AAGSASGTSARCRGGSSWRRAPFCRGLPNGGKPAHTTQYWVPSLTTVRVLPWTLSGTLVAVPIFWVPTSLLTVTMLAEASVLPTTNIRPATFRASASHAVAAAAVALTPTQKSEFCTRLLGTATDEVKVRALTFCFSTRG